MTRPLCALAATTAAALVCLSGAQVVRGPTLDNNPVQHLESPLLSLIPEPIVDPLEDPPGQFKAVKPQEFDPAGTHLVQAAWLHGIGCPTNGFIAIPNATFTGVQGTTPYSDAACPSGDPNDLRNEGLLLAKTGSTSNFASATAELINIKGLSVSELGYDIRKPLSSVDPRSEERR